MSDLGRTADIHERRLSLLTELSVDRWERVMDMGGSNGSHHSNDLRYLVDRGLAEKRSRSSWYTRPSWLYRRTEAGTTHVASGPIVVSKSVARRLAVQMMDLSEEQRQAVMEKFERQDEDEKEGVAD